MLHPDLICVEAQSATRRRGHCIVYRALCNLNSECLGPTGTGSYLHMDCTVYSQDKVILFQSISLSSCAMGPIFDYF